MRKLLMERGTDMFRTKGVINFIGEKHPYVLQAVHMLMGGTMDATKIIDGNSENMLVFIGRNLDREELNNSFASCMEI
jgi:G3E family GTPase